jgi:multidrug efflux pump subunit AcrB
MGIVRFALRFPHTFYVVAALILFLGSVACIKMPTDIFPEINIPVVTVIWSYTGLSTPEMEQRVTTYSQYSIRANVNGIKNIEAQTMAGLSVQKIYFQPDVNRPRDCADRLRDQCDPRADAARDPAAHRGAVQRLQRAGAGQPLFRHVERAAAL